jgi:soluble lytic murein transglycosylase
MLLTPASCRTWGAADTAFYRGLTAQGELASASFRAALRSANPLIREAAALKLPPRLPDSGAAALILGESADRVGRWAELLPPEGPEEGPVRFSPAEYAAIQGRLATARSAFGPALERFREALEDPFLFLRHAETLTDLGRSFQFGDSGAEGSLLFQAWDEALGSGSLAGGGLPERGSGEERALRYRLRYFAARIERQRGNYERSVELFNAALELAPDSLQSDACIWYILGMILERGDPLPALELYLPRVERYAVVEDLLERYAYTLVAGRRWESLLRVYGLLAPHRDSSSLAQYAYILGRAAECGYLPAAGEPFFLAARGEEAGAFYYRGLASARLGGPPLDIPGESSAGAGPGEHREEMAFLLGFFEHGAAGFAWPYISEMIGDLSIPELRALARALQKEERWDESLRLVSRWMEREGYRWNRADMELYYPRPFLEQTERYAREAGLPPWLLFGLIRTESAFMPEALSSARAVGLTQLMPDTAEEMAGRLRRQGGGESAALDLTDPDTNLRLGAAYLRRLEDLLGNPLMSLLAYNGGLGRVRRWQRAAAELPPDLAAETVSFSETRAYARRVCSAAAAYGFLYYGLTMESILSDIVNGESR